MRPRGRDSVENLNNFANLNDIDLRLVRNSHSQNKHKKANEQEKSAGLSKMLVKKESQQPDVLIKEQAPKKLTKAEIRKREKEGK